MARKCILPRFAGEASDPGGQPAVNAGDRIGAGPWKNAKDGEILAVARAFERAELPSS